MPISIGLCAFTTALSGFIKLFCDRNISWIQVCSSIRPAV